MPNTPTRRQLTTAATVILSLAVVLVIHGSIPFLSIPTLGQAIWATGFSQSFANDSTFSIYAKNFGNPEPAAISFGLSGAYPTSILIRLGLHPADAYTVITTLFITLAFFGAWKIARMFKLDTPRTTLVTILWMSMPIFWWHAGYSYISYGIGLLPFYFWTSLALLRCTNNSKKIKYQIAISNILAALLAVFMDGYSFMMFATASSLFAASVFLRFPEQRKSLLSFALPVHLFSFFFAYIMYVTFLGKSNFETSPIDFFRGWGADLLFLVAPSKGVHWIWDLLGFSQVRTVQEQFGDESVWMTTFALPILLVGFIAWWKTHREAKIASGFLIIALFGFYMALGPSFKIDSVRPAQLIATGDLSPAMSAKLAIAPTGSALLSAHLPGFINMRASYRWAAMGFLGLWLLVVLLLSQVKTTRSKCFIIPTVIFLIISNLPNIGFKLYDDVGFRDDFFDIEHSLVKDMKGFVHEGEMIAFLPFRNDFFANYLASRLKIHTYNIGGDKNLVEASRHWPPTMKQFTMGEIDERFVGRVLLLLARREADSVVLPHIDFLTSAHYWPAPDIYKAELKPILARLQRSGYVQIYEREHYTLVRLAKEYAWGGDPGKAEAMLREVTDQYYAKEHLEVGKKVGFGNNTAAQLYLTTGWSALEPWGVWSNAEKAELRFRLRSNNKPVRFALKLSLSPFKATGKPKQDVSISINNVSRKFELTSPQELILPFTPDPTGINVVVFTIKDPVSPSDLKISSDDRDLGIGLISIQLLKI